MRVFTGIATGAPHSVALSPFSLRIRHRLLLFIQGFIDPKEVFCAALYENSVGWAAVSRSTGVKNRADHAWRPFSEAIRRSRNGPNRFGCRTIVALYPLGLSWFSLTAPHAWFRLMPRVWRVGAMV